MRVLGVTELLHDARRERVARKPFELLCLLMVSRQRAAHDGWLIDQLWRGKPPPTASSALRVYLAKLRSALEPDRGNAPSSRLAKTVGGWRLRLEPYELDLARFEASAAEAATSLQGGFLDQAWTASGEALSEWLGAPFSGIDLEALVDEANRLTLVRRRTERLRWDVGLRCGRAQQVLPDLCQAYEENLLDEELAELLSRATYLAGDQQAAIDLLRRFRRRLSDELGLDAGPRIDATERAILRHELRIPEEQEVLGGSWTAAVIDRPEVVSRLDQALRLNQVVALVGEPGIGKSTLIGGFQLPGHRVLRVRCAASAAPLRLVHDLLASLAQGPSDAAAWASLRSALKRWQAGIPDPIGASLLAEDLLADLVRAEPTLICIDDAHHLDPTSAEAISRAVVPVGSARLLLVSPQPTSSVPGEVVGAEPTGTKSPLIPNVVVEMPPLPEQFSRQLLARLRAAGGHDRLSDDSALTAAAGNPWLLDVLTMGTPRAGLAARMLGGLSAECESGSLRLAVIGVPISLKQATGLVGSDVLEQLLVTRVLIVASGTCVFRHGLLAEAFCREASQQELAHAAAEVVRRAPSAGLEPLDLAGAVELAGALMEDRDIAAWALAAGRQALSGGGVQRARELFDLAEQRAGSALGMIGSARLGRAQSLVGEGDLAAARDWFVRSLRPLQEVGADEQVADAVLGYVGMMGPESAEVPIVEAITMWLVKRSHLPDARLLAVLDARASTANELGDAAEPRTLELLEASQKSTDPAAAVYRLRGSWRLEYNRGASHRRLAPLAGAVADAARSLADDGLLVRALRNHADHLLGSGRAYEAQECHAELEAVSHRCRSAQGRWWVALMEAERALRAGDLEHGMALASAAFSTWDRLPLSSRSEALTLQQLIAAFQAGQLDMLVSELVDAEGQFSISTGNSLLPEASIAVMAQLGLQPDTHTLRSVIATLRSTTRGWLDSPKLYLLGRAAIFAGLSDPWLESQLERHAGCWVLLGTGVATAGPVDAVLAGLAEFRDDHQSARVLAHQAQLLCDKMNAPFWRTDTDVIMRTARNHAGHAS